MHYTESHNIPGLLLLVDFEKLDKTLYNNSQSCVIQNEKEVVDKVILCHPIYLLSVLNFLQI